METPFVLVGRIAGQQISKLNVGGYWFCLVTKRKTCTMIDRLVSAEWPREVLHTGDDSYQRNAPDPKNQVQRQSS